MTGQPNAERVVVVGPLPPFRGGIAQHTGMLCQAIAKRADLLAVSFTKLYPDWLYPGESSRDPDAGPITGFAVRHIIAWDNPFTWRTAVAAMLAHDPDLVVIPWWTVFWAPCFWYLARSSRRRGHHVRILCHNVAEHEPAWWKTALAAMVLRQASSFAVHTEVEAEILRRRYPARPVVVHPQPVFAHFPEPEPEDALPRRAPLELLFYGFVRPYKGLPVLIEAMGLLRGAPVQLTIAGEFWSGREETERRIATLGIGERVELVPRYVTDRETAALFDRADAVVLPYRSVTNSGIVAIAYRYGKPVIVTRVGGLPEVVIDGETGLIVPADDPRALADCISALSAERAAAMTPAVERLKDKLSWETLAENILEVP